MSISIRNSYFELGVDNFYKQNSNSYQNPHEKIIFDHLNKMISFIDTKNVLDLCCGSGEVTRFLLNKNVNSITGCDPYTYDLYKAKTGKNCLTKNFKSIINNGLDDYYSCIICSFALHLCEKSMLNNLLFVLSQHSKQLLILSPHKKPDINLYWQIDYELYANKVRSRLFKNKTLG